MNLTDLLIPPSLDARQALRLRHFGLAALSYALGAALVAAGWAFDMVSASTALEMAAAILAVNLGLYAVFRSGFNLRFEDSSLTRLQILVAITVLMQFIYHLDVARNIALLACFIVFLFGVFRLNAREFTVVTLYTLAAYALVINLLMHFRPQAIQNVLLEWISWLTLAGILTCFAAIGVQINALRLKLREREAGLRRAQLMAGLAHVVTGPDGSFDSWSETLPRLIGVDSAGMPKSTRGWLELIHPDDRALFRDTSIEAGRRGTRMSVEYRMRHEDSAWIHVSQVMEPIEGQAGTAGTQRWFNTLQDVSRERQAAEALRASEERHRAMFEQAAVGIVHTTLDGNVQMVNAKFCDMSGYTRAEAVQLTIRDLICPEDVEKSLGARSQVLSGTEAPYELEPRLLRKDRSEIWVHVTTSLVRAADGQPSYFISVLDDITERKRAEHDLRESESRFRSLTTLSSDWYWEQDEEHRFVKFSGGEQYGGWGKDQLSTLGLRRWELPGVIPASGSWNEHKALIETRKPFRNFEYQRIFGDGRLQYAAASGEPVFDASGRYTGYRGVATDITERKQADNRIRRLNRVYSVLSGINSAIVRIRERDELFREACRIAVSEGGFILARVLEVDSNGRARIAATSESDSRLYQRLLDEYNSNPEHSQNLIALALRSGQPVISNDVANDPRIPGRAALTSEGTYALALLPIIVEKRVAGAIILRARETGMFDEAELRLLLELVSNLSFALELMDKQSKLDYLAYYDALTGLANRSLFHERLAQYLRASNQGQTKSALALMNVERFKTINDSLGRQAGDELLKQLAGRLAGATDRANVARIGGDQFAVVLPEVKGHSEVARTVERIWRECFAQPFRVGDTELRISAKAGIALFPNDGADADTLFANAEAALQKAQVTGERHQFYTRELTAGVAEEFALENKLRRAFENDEFVLHYQPKVDLETRSIVGMEALIRWQSPELGLVPPMKFIPLMEETGLILPVGSWALKRASLDHRSWVNQGLKAPRVAVNVSPIQLRQRDFVSAVEQAIMEGVAPTGIDLEITESLIMEDVQGSIEKLKTVRGLGVGIAIDDFGTGYSSLGYLAKLPVQTLKIDRSFIITMLGDPDTMTLVSTIISLAHSLRLKVIAEGVDAEEQAKVLRLLRCDQMQGYLFSKPIPFEAMTALLKQEKMV